MTDTPATDTTTDDTTDAGMPEAAPAAEATKAATPAGGVQFADLKLDPKVLQAVTEAGYTTPTPIQAGAIPPALEGRDVLGIAQTGTGKTAGFVLPMITLLGRGRARARMPRSLVLCPTRELAAQVAENFDTYAKHTRLTKALLIGGVSMRDQEMLIGRGVDVLIATPGRLLDHFERGNLLLQGVQIMVVDEADRMLDMGFIPDIERIFQLTPFTRQTLFFSATMAPEIERITDTFLHAPARIEVARQATASETITQRLLEITPTRKDQTAKQKRQLLRAVIEAEGEALKNAIIFCNRKTEVDVVAKSLKAHGYDAAPIHGDLDQSQRTRTLDGFREGTLRFLIASDVAARGLDIPAVSHVFNFDLPSHAEDYVHRIGRTGRAGRAGTAISLAVPADEKYLTAIENLLKRSLPRAPVPEGFAMTEGAEEPARAPRETGRATSRTRSRRGGRAEERAGSTVAVPRAEASQARAVEVADDRDDPRTDSRRPEAVRPEPAPREPVEVRRDERPDARADQGRDERDQRRSAGGRDDVRPDSPRREDARRDDGRREGRRDEGRREESRRDDPRSGRGGASVAGFGEHLPDFMTRSFRTNLPPLAEGDSTEGDTDAAETAILSVVEEVVAMAAAPEAARDEATVPAPRAGRRPRAGSAKPQAGAEAAEGRAAADATEMAEAPKPARRRRSAKKADALTEDAAAAEAKPRTSRTRTRRKPAAEETPAASEGEARPAPETDAGSEAEAGQSAAPAEADHGTHPAHAPEAGLMGQSSPAPEGDGDA